MESSQETSQRPLEAAEPVVEPSLLEYARYHKLSEDYMDASPLAHSDLSCVLIPPQPLEGVTPADPEKRMEEVNRIFCTGIMMGRLPAKSEDVETLRTALHPKPVKGNIWRGLLPVLKTTDLGPTPVLQTAEDEEAQFNSLQQEYLVGPVLSSAPAPPFPGASAPANTGVNEFSNTFVSDYHPVDIPDPTDVNLDDSPVTHVVVPSGPDIPMVPRSMREVFDQYNSSPVPAYHSARSSGVDDFNGAIDSSGEVKYSIESESPLDDLLFDDSELMKDLRVSAACLEKLGNPQSEDNLFDQNTVQNFMFEEVSSNSESQSLANLFSPYLTKSKAPSAATGTSVEALAQEVRLAGDVKQGGGCLWRALDTIRSARDKDIVTTSEGESNQYKPIASNAFFSSSAIQAGDQILSHMAASSPEAKQTHLLPIPPCAKISETVGAPTLSVAEQWKLCAAYEKAFLQRAEYYSPTSRKKEQFIEVQNAARSVNLNKAPTTSNQAFASLGSLSVFMQTRGSQQGGTLSQNELMSTSASSIGSSGTSNAPLLKHTSSPRSNNPPTPRPPVELSRAVTRGAAEAPRAIFVSTDLLQTHPRLIQYMEEWEKSPPELIYRGYHQPAAQIQCPPDADLIVAPDTGVILTTPFELTQRYPPGHGSAPARPNGVTDVVSELRERVWKLASRYENLFVLISLPDNGSQATRIAETQLKNEFPAFSDFCQTLEYTARVEPVPLDHHPVSIMMWCFGLAKIFGEYSLSFPVSKSEETESETELRQAGLNPFAARAILDNPIDASTEGNPAPSQNLSLGNTDNEASALDSFLGSLGSEYTQERYKSLVGPRVISRLHEGVATIAHSMSSVDIDEADIHSELVEFD